MTSARSRSLATLRYLRAPLAALCAVLLCWNMFLGAAVAAGPDSPFGALCSGLVVGAEGVSEDGWAEGHAGACPFCSACATMVVPTISVPVYRLAHDDSYLVPIRAIVARAVPSVWHGPPPMRGPPHTV